MARCSCGGVIKTKWVAVNDDIQHGEKTLQSVEVCEDCGRRYDTERPFIRTHPTKEERAAG